MGEQQLNQNVAWRIGQTVQIIAGPFIGSKGVIYLIDPKERLVRVMIDVFKKQTPVEVPLSSITALENAIE
jgi:transcription antitermination factor NusG